MSAISLSLGRNQRRRPWRIFAVLLLIAAPSPSIAADDYRLVISFASRCCGPNMSAMKKLETQLRRSEKEAGQLLKVETRSLGPEGEVAMCYRLGELNEAQQVDLVKRISQSLAKEPLVDVQQHASCPDARRGNQPGGRGGS